MILEPIVYGISPYDSNAMKSDNPKSGIYEAKTSRTLDLNGGNPACNQGGMIVLEGNGARPSHQGDGYLESDKMYTLNTIERHAVAYSIGNGQVHDAMSPSKEVCKTLNCMDDPMKVMVAYASGNGQACNMQLSDKFGALDCMHDQKCVVIKRSTEKLDGTQND